MLRRTYSVPLLIFFVGWISCIEIEENISIEELYQRGVDNYLSENWGECKLDLQAVLRKYKRMLTAIADCRLRCTQNGDIEYLNPQDIEGMHFYEKIVRRTLCFMKCTRTYYEDVEFNRNSDGKALKDLESGEIYMYLQSCYLKENEIQNAASAAFTYLTLHPDDKVTRETMKFYLELPGIKSDEITNYEVQEYYPLYLKGVASYEEEDWGQAVAYIEEAIHEFIAANEKCRVLCEGSFDQGWFPDFMTSISNHFTYSLQCKQRCSEKLKTLDKLQGEHLLANFYNYLQFAYYKLKKIPQSLQCVASYLLVYPDDEEMLRNKKIYLDREDAAHFEPRPEIVYYLGRDAYEKKLLKFIHEEFTAEIKLREKDGSSEKSVKGNKKTIDLIEINEI